jgi:phytoene dehydrogenase-like protein
MGGMTAAAMLARLGNRVLVLEQHFVPGGSTDFFTRAVGGSIYGLEPTPARFRCRWLRPHSPIRDLYFAGSEVGTVGVMGALNGGMLAATAVAPRKALPYLRRRGV